MFPKITTSKIDWNDIATMAVPDFQYQGAEKDILRVLDDVGYEEILYCYITRIYNEKFGENVPAGSYVLAFSSDTIFILLRHTDKSFFRRIVVIDHKTTLVIKNEEKYREFSFDRVNQGEGSFFAGYGQIGDEIQLVFDELVTQSKRLHPPIEDKFYMELDEDFEQEYYSDKEQNDDPLHRSREIKYLDETKRNEYLRFLKDPSKDHYEIEDVFKNFIGYFLSAEEVADLLTSNFHLVNLFYDLRNQLFSQIQYFGYTQVMGAITVAYQNPFIAVLFTDLSRQYNYYQIRAGVADYRFYGQMLGSLKNLEWALSNTKEELLQMLSSHRADFIEQETVLKALFHPKYALKISEVIEIYRDREDVFENWGILEDGLLGLSEDSSSKDLYELSKVFNDSDEEAEQKIGAYESPKAKELCEYLLLPNSYLVSVIVRVLKRNGEPQSILPLCKLLLTSGDIRVRLETIKALSTFGGDHAAEALFKFVSTRRNDVETNEIEEAIYALSKLGPIGISRLEKIVDSEYGWIKDEAVSVLKRIGGYKDQPNR